MSHYMDLEIPVGFIHLNFLAGSSLIRLVNVNVMPDLKKNINLVYRQSDCVFLMKRRNILPIVSVILCGDNFQPQTSLPPC